MDITFLLLYILTPATIFAFLKVSGDSVLKSNILSPLILSYFLFSFIGFPLLFINSTGYNYLVGTFDFKILTKTFLYSVVSIFILVTSFILTKQTLSFYHKDSRKITSVKSVGNKFIAIIFLIIGILILVYYISRLSELAITQIILGLDSNEIIVARSEATNNLTNAWRYKFFPGFVLPFLSYYFYTEFKITKKKSNNILFLITALITLFYGVMNAQKGPVLFYIWSLIFIKYYIEKKKIDLKILIFFILGSLIFLILLLFLITRSNFDSILFGIFNRITASSITSGYFYVKTFPTEHPFLTGLSSPNPRGIFPFESFELTKFIKLKMEGVSPSGAVGSAPGPFWSELHANFGFPGVILGSTLIGAVLAFIEKIFNSLRLNSINVAIFTLTVFQFRELSTSGPLPLLFPLQLVLVAMIAMIIQFSIKKHRE